MRRAALILATVVLLAGSAVAYAVAASDSGSAALDAHQVQIPNEGGQAANTAWFPSTANC